ncbi:hypothetical protein IC619_001245 [Hazenella sp. IB182353]|uniref:hypothetical protein n=1 Tax=Polycladospora coralii TaxID=2771432 RepID=UPI0017464C06|nr:hypothetical protein [Polycladospora coralii]MBS7529118.1 hypothetical protein [Polycladospora coralii]
MKDFIFLPISILFIFLFEIFFKGSLAGDLFWSWLDFENALAYLFIATSIAILVTRIRLNASLSIENPIKRKKLQRLLWVCIYFMVILYTLYAYVLHAILFIVIFSVIQGITWIKKHKKSRSFTVMNDKQSH